MIRHILFGFLIVAAACTGVMAGLTTGYFVQQYISEEVE